MRPYATDPRIQKIYDKQCAERTLNRTQKLLGKKPNLKLCSNHFGDKLQMFRVWDSKKFGTAYSDGKGWFVSKKK